MGDSCGFWPWLALFGLPVVIFFYEWRTALFRKRIHELTVRDGRRVLEPDETGHTGYTDGDEEAEDLTNDNFEGSAN